MKGKVEEIENRGSQKYGFTMVKCRWSKCKGGQCSHGANGFMTKKIGEVNIVGHEETSGGH